MDVPGFMSVAGLEPVDDGLSARGKARVTVQ